VLEATIPENSFFAIGFGYTMLQTDMIVWQAYPTDVSDVQNPVQKWVVSDRWSTIFGMPDEDDIDHLTSTAEFNE